MKILAAVLVVAGLTALSPAQALPLAPLAAPADTVIRVAGGCGAGFHRGPYGGCLKNYDHPAAHACPRGYHVGPNGGCRGNGR
jgi:hypothetical protein